MAKYKSRRRPDQGCQLEMTPMIDVVFQLMIYFIVTMKPPDVAAHLDVFKPSAGHPPPDVKEQPRMIQIDIHQGALIMNGRSVSMDSLTDILGKLASYSKTQTVIIKCALDSRHDDLIKVLDCCAKTGMSNLSVMSMN